MSGGLSLGDLGGGGAEEKPRLVQDHHDEDTPTSDESEEEPDKVEKEAKKEKPARRLKAVGKLAKPRRLKAEGPPVSAHLWYPGGAKVTGFQVGLRVPHGKDIVSTYFMACGWHRGYFGMQVNSCPSERRILFSCWDDGKGTDVGVLDTNAACLTKKFGGEGTGRQCIRWHHWDPEDLVLFRVFAAPNPDDDSTNYKAYFQHKGDEWVFMCEYRSPNDGKYLEGLYSFLENFGSDRKLPRECYYSHQAIQKEGSEEWIPLRSARCTISSCPDSDYHYHGVTDGAFVMQIGGTKGMEESDDFCKRFVPKTLILDDK